ncbi:MAG: phage tail protein [Saprospiraceae bacterium]
MAEPFISEIRLMSFGYAPQGWAQCNGQLLPINQNQALFSLLGTTYGGNGQVNFALPDFKGRTPIHTGGGHTLGERAGAQVHTLTINEIPAHTHTLNAIAPSNNGTNTSITTNNFLSNSAPAEMYSNNGSSLAPAIAGTLTSIGGSQPHTNMQPFLVINFCIALQGIFPSQN